MSGHAGRVTLPAVGGGTPTLPGGASGAKLKREVVGAYILYLADVFEGERAQTLFERLVADPDLDRTTVYFSYYLFETYFKFHRADLFLRRLDMWKDYETRHRPWNNGAQVGFQPSQY